jgi:hypothetical protein
MQSIPVLRSKRYSHKVTPWFVTSCAGKSQDLKDVFVVLLPSVVHALVFYPIIHITSHPVNPPYNPLLLNHIHLDKTCMDLPALTHCRRRAVSLRGPVNQSIPLT